MMDTAAQSIVIIDTGCANLASVGYALKRLGVRPLITDSARAIKQADKVILPGVGTAKAAMRALADKQLIETIQALTQPLLGICLGMQLLAQSSEEGHVDTLGIIEGDIRKMATEANLTLPHMGWNQVTATTPTSPLFAGIDPDSYFYFVHSFALPVTHATIATSDYDQRFSAAVAKDNFFGVQFHPERSGPVGAKLLNNFLEL